MEKKRLTKKGGLNFADKDLSLADEWGYSHIYNRLAELEDKIEQGTLVDTEKHFIKEDDWWGRKNRYLVCMYYVETLIVEFCETREEAEKLLKELQG